LEFTDEVIQIIISSIFIYLNGLCMFKRQHFTKKVSLIDITFTIIN